MLAQRKKIAKDQGTVAGGLVLSHALRMPLDGYDWESCVKQSLQHLILTILGRQQAGAQPVYGLVMSAVGDKLIRIEGMEKGSRENPGGMSLVFFLPGVGSAQRFGQILEKSSPQGNVNELHTLADAKDGFFCLTEGIKHRQLKLIQGQIYVSGALICLAEKTGVDIAAPRQQKAVKI